jgi:ELWxxDGT repeat protein
MVKKLLSVFGFVFQQDRSFALRIHTLVIGLCAIFSSANAQTTLFADLNKTGARGPGGVIEQLVYANGLLFFTDDNRRRLWRSDGTAEGTYQLAGDGAGGVFMGSMDGLFSCGDRMYFTALGELWVSYGVDVKMIDLSASGYSLPSNFANVNGVLFFNATNNVSGAELWKAWGGQNDVAMVADILRGTGGSNPMELENVNGICYFTANDGTNGYELWKSNGTAAGTVMVKDVRPGLKLSSTPRQITNVNGTVFFSAYDAVNGRELWKTDGTAAGTAFVKDIRAGTAESVPDNLTAVGSTLYFAANNETNGRELWKSDGTAAGTVLVKDITPGSASNTGGGYTHLSYFTVYNGTLYFMAYTDRPRLWKTDGTATGTIPVTPLDRHFVGINPNLTVFNGLLYYVTNDNFDPDRGYMQMWKTNGDPANHTEVRSGLGLWQNYDMELTAGDDKIYFTIWASGTSEEEVWFTDGTSQGTQKIEGGGNTGSGSPTNMTTMFGSVYFAATNGSQYGLFKTDGTTQGTRLLEPIPGKLKYFYASHNLLYFIQVHPQAPTCVLWRSDGTTEGTWSLADLNSPDAVIDYETLSSGLVFFRVRNTLWRTDGTDGGTYPLRSFSSDIGWIASAGEELLLAANDGVRGLELWRSNGTAAGTVLQRDINPAGNSSLLMDSRADSQVAQEAAVTLDNVVYFLANAGGDPNYELWRSDGTGGTGTRMLKNDETGKPFTPINSLRVANNRVFLFTYEGMQGDTYNEKRTLWSSDGTTTGTIPIYPFIHDISTGEMLVHVFPGGGQHFYFATTVYLDPAYLYASDGTAAGTTKVADLGTFESAGPLHAAFDGQKAYLASGHMYDKFLVRSDGTACGTDHVQVYTDYHTVDLYDFWLAVLDHKLYLNSYTDQHGDELYRYEDNSYSPCSASTMMVQAVEAAPEEETTMTVTAHPNPSERFFTVSMPDAEGGNFSLEVTGMDGIVIERRENLDSKSTYELGEGWQPGIYILKVRTGDSVLTERLVKRR